MAEVAKDSTFRKKSLERAAYPEQLDQCIRVPGPGAWAALMAIVLLLAAAGAYLALGSIPLTDTMRISVRDGVVTGEAPGLADGEYEVEVPAGEQSVSSLVLGS